MKKNTILAFAILLTATAFTHAADKAEIDTHCNNYRAAGKAIVEMAINKKIDVAEVEKKVQILLTESSWGATEYAKVHPKGEKLLKTIVDNIEAMKKLSFKDIEHEWHDLNHFTKSGSSDLGIDVKAEDNEHFTDPIHSIVHPILVLKAAQTFATSKDEAELKAVKEEMEEGLEQMEKVRTILSKK